MLIVFPIGLWIFSLVCDLVAMSASVNVLFWKDMAFYTMAGGVSGALLAAVPGFIDYLGLRDRVVSRIATTHMVLNLLITALFIFNLGLRMNAADNGGLLVVALSVVSLVLLSVSGWLGGEMVYRQGVGVTTNVVERDRIDRAA